MSNRVANDTVEAGLDDVSSAILKTLKQTALAPIVDEFKDSMAGGKMIRSRLILRVSAATSVSYEDVINSAAAIEMIHAASLLHDDVIDHASMRRGVNSFWVEKGVSGAILMGDLLVCKAISHAGMCSDSSLVSTLVELSGEMCEAEAQQDLLLHDVTPDWDMSVSIARRKTGTLFAFAGYASAGRDERLKDALKEAGYNLGTAYQLADDIYDAYGDQQLSGKTLGGDAASSKITAGTALELSNVDPIKYIDQLLNSSEELLADWPEVREAFNSYIAMDVRSVVNKFTEKFLVGAAS